VETPGNRLWGMGKMEESVKLGNKNSPIPIEFKKGLVFWVSVTKYKNSQFGIRV